MLPSTMIMVAGVWVAAVVAGQPGELGDRSRTRERAERVEAGASGERSWLDGLRVLAPAAPGAAPDGPLAADHFTLAAEYSEAHGGLSVLVMRDGAVVFERYAGGTDSGDTHPLASGTKSFSGVMLAAAIEDGLISGFDELVADTIGEWKTDPRKSRITLRQLLSLTSGLDAGGIGRPPSYADAVTVATFAEPGTSFRYGPAPFQVFGEVMRRKLSPTGESVRGYLERRILRPLGIEVGWWNTDANGNINLPSGAALSAREWAKFGEFMLNSGRVRREGGWTQVVRADLLAELVRSGAVNPRYGVTFWLLSDSGGLDPEEALRGQTRRQAVGPVRRAIRGALQRTLAACGESHAACNRPRRRMAASPPLAVIPLEYCGAAAPCPATAGPVSATQHFRHRLLGSTSPGGGTSSGEGLPLGREADHRVSSTGVSHQTGTSAQPAVAAPTKGEEAAFMAAGLGKQRLYVLPEQGLVVVRQGRMERDSNFKDAEFLKRLRGEAATDSAVSKP